MNVIPRGFGAAIRRLAGLEPDPSSASWIVAPTVEYAAYQEHGTRYTPAQPFMRPAARQVQTDVARHAANAASLEDAVQSAALAVEAEAKRQAPVDTGALRASIQAQPAGGF